MDEEVTGIIEKDEADGDKLWNMVIPEEVER